MSFSSLDRPVQFLKGVGPRRAESLAQMEVLTARDMLYHIPRRYDDATTVHPIASAKVGEEVTVVGRIRSKGVIPTRKGLRIFQAVLEDDSGMITCAWPGQPWLDRKLREGDRLLAQGTVRFYHGRQLAPKEFTLLDRDGKVTGSGAADAEGPGAIFVSYPASEEIPQWVLRGIFEKNLDTLLKQVEGDEYLPESELDRLGLPDLPSALELLHRPPSVHLAGEGRRRLAFDELFFLQLVHARVRWQESRERPGTPMARTDELIRPLYEALPFSLTEAQARVLREIYADLTSPRRMNRMLQGDVGAGKTVVAVFAMLLAVESGRQAALMAPTEILAEQHAVKIRAMLEPLEVRVDLLTGRSTTAQRREVLSGLQSGKTPIVVGTHALIQEGVSFRDLGLVVVDEQHRFGVRQRMALGERHGDPDVLIMSATPIPRSLAMTLYGDLDLSVLDERPPGRKPVETVLLKESQRDRAWDLVREQLDEGRQAYLVYPLVEESEKVDLKSATEEHRRLSEEVFPDRRVGLLHGQLASEEKDAVMRAFRDGELDIVVATTVIEVGIDVPNATVMVIEHAERFGLSQLHQLRGRVGRGGERSWCLLVSDGAGAAGERLRIFRETEDGFAVAKADLRIRGQGDLFGDAQSGKDPRLRFADLLQDEDLLVEAQRRARRVIEEDPDLTRPEHARIRHLLEERWRERMELFQVG